MTPQQIWQAALGELQLQMTKATFDTWLKHTFVISYEDGTFVIGVHNTYAKEWLENRLLSTIKRTLVGIMGRAVEVKFVVRVKNGQTEHSVSLLETTADTSPVSYRPSPKMLNPHYTFETFIVGNSNRLAHAASVAVAEKPAEAYNPLFIYGGVGLGKTHLLHAIGHVPLRKKYRVLYVSSEEFVNDLVNSIRQRRTEEFRRRYRDIDVLLMDDIQFIAGKEAMQEEFFHTFNALHAANKQIVISSDRSPKAITPLEERLRSRFEWGLIADIQPPDLETRIAILRFKAEAYPIPIPAEIIDFIAHKVQSNIRQLEGALNRLVAYGQMMRCALTVELAMIAIRDLTVRRHSLSPEEIIEAVARFYGLETADLMSRRRSKAIAVPRQVAMYLIREETNASFPRIGRALGGRDHTTVLYAHNKISAQIEEDNHLRRQILAIKETLYTEATKLHRIEDI